MNLQEIIERFTIIANLSESEVYPWISLCEDACEEIKNHLKSGVSIQDNSRRLCVAAAALAFYRYALYRASSGAMESFTAGELRIKTDSKLSAQIAYSVWRDARNAVSDLLKDDEFIFERIK